MGLLFYTKVSQCHSFPHLEWKKVESQLRTPVNCLGRIPDYPILPSTDTLSTALGMLTPGCFQSYYSVDIHKYQRMLALFLCLLLDIFQQMFTTNIETSTWRH